MLCGLIGLLAAADLLAAAAPAYWVMVVSRVLVGVVIGAFWSIGSGLADRLVRPGSARTATAVIFSAVPLGSVPGVPLGTFVGNLAGWRTAFLVLAVLTVGVLVAQLAVVPALPATVVTGLDLLRDLLRRNGVRAGIVVTVLVVLAHFGTYTYVTPFPRDVTGVSPRLITVFLLVSTHLRATFACASGLIAGATLLLLVGWGLGYGAVPVCSQAWFIASAPHTPEAATISVGALLGGVLVNATSTSAVLVVGGLVGVPAALACLVRLRTW